VDDVMSYMRMMTWPYMWMMMSYVVHEDDDMSVHVDDDVICRTCGWWHVRTCGWWCHMSYKWMMTYMWVGPLLHYLQLI